MRVRLLFLAVFFVFITSLVFATSYYVDYAGGSDSANGLSTTTAWKHTPGDTAATSNPASATLKAGDTVFFKGGVKYIIAGPCPCSSSPGMWAGIQVNWSGTPTNPITYDGSPSGWGSGRAIITDNHATFHYAAFGGNTCATGAPPMSNVVFKNLEIGPMGGGDPLPTDPGHGIPSNPAWGIWAAGPMTNVTIDNVYFHELGYWQAQKPIGGGSIDGAAIQLDNGGTNVVIKNCEITKTHSGIEFNAGANTQNVEIANNDLHDYIVWGIDLIEGGGSNEDYLQIHNNKFHGFGIYGTAQDTSYDSGAYHQDIIFDRACYLCNPPTANTGLHRNIYNNTFYDTVKLTEPHVSAYIYLSDSLSANIYNNLFEDPILAPSPPHVVAFTADTLVSNTNIVRIINNTFVMNQFDAYSWDDTTKSPMLWQTNNHVIAANNILYQAAPSSAYWQYCSAIDPAMTNLSDELASMTVNHNLYYNATLSNYFQWTTIDGTHQPLGTDIAGMRSMYGMELNGVAGNPKFADISHGFDTSAYLNDYHLQSTSPAIGAGANYTDLNLPGLNADFEGKARPASGAWDIGAYQYSSTPQPNYHPADTNGNWSITLAEYLAYANCWKTTCNWNANGTIPLSFYLNAANIWKNGPLTYHSTATGCPPNAPSTCWAAGS